jgi:hypothetical protein
MAMMRGKQNRQRYQHQRGNQPTAPPSIFGLRGQLEGLETPFEPPDRVVIGTRCTN